jgi:hypothetical protein
MGHMMHPAGRPARIARGLPRNNVEGTIMIRSRSTLLALALAALGSSQLGAQEVRHFEENGIQYRETTHVTQRAIPETKWVPSETTQVAPRYVTDYQEQVRTYQVPVTEQQWVPGLQRTWNIFAPPVLSYRLMPVTRWETRTETVRVPVTKVEYVPYKQVQHIPVTNTRIAEERVVSRVALGPASSSSNTAVARNESTQPLSPAPSQAPAMGGLDSQALQDPYATTPRQSIDRR